VLGTSIERHFRTAMDRRERIEFERPSVARPDRLVRWRLFPTPEGLGVAIDDVTERREAEQRVRETNERLRALADNLPSGLVYQILCRRDGSDRRFIYVSEACERVTGVTAAAALADPAALMNAFPPDQLQHLAAAEAIALERLEALDVEVAMQRPDGERVWTRIISAPRELDDEYLLWDGIQIDISEQRRAEQARLAAEERGRLAAQAADIGVWDWDPVAQQLRWDLRCKPCSDWRRTRLSATTRSSSRCTRRTGRGSRRRLIARSIRTAPGTTTPSTASSERTGWSAGYRPAAAACSMTAAQSASSAPWSTSPSASCTRSRRPDYSTRPNARSPSGAAPRNTSSC
jgi:PAS domain S-box-containing protein